MKEVKSPKKPLIYYYCIALAVIFLLNNLLFPKMLEMQIKEVDYGTFLSMLEEENIEEVEVEENQIVFSDRQDPQKFYKTGRMEDPDLVDRLHAADVRFGSEIVQQASPIVSWFISIVLMILLGQLLSHYMMKKMGGGPQSMTFGKSNAKIYVESKTGIKFSDVAGEDEAKEIYVALKDRQEKVFYIDRDSTSFRKGITVTTYYMAKGLEFDQVFVVGKDPSHPFYRQFLYICATRALHELYIKRM